MNHHVLFRKDLSSSQKKTLFFFKKYGHDHFQFQLLSRLKTPPICGHSPLGPSLLSCAVPFLTLKPLDPKPSSCGVGGIPAQVFSKKRQRW